MQALDVKEASILLALKGGVAAGDLDSIELHEHPRRLRLCFDMIGKATEASLWASSCRLGNNCRRCRL